MLVGQPVHWQLLKTDGNKTFKEFPAKHIGLINQLAGILATFTYISAFLFMLF